jgi:hypothetical protein
MGCVAVDRDEKTCYAAVETEMGDGEGNRAVGTDGAAADTVVGDIVVEFGGVGHEPSSNRSSDTGSGMGSVHIDCSYPASQTHHLLVDIPSHSGHAFQPS